MQYLLLIYHEEALWDAVPESEKQAIYGRYRALRQELMDAGKFKGGSQLQSTSAATVVRLRDGKTAITDGPFAETKEALGGYFLIEARDLDDALEIAARIPSAATGLIEVRPLVGI